MPRNNQYPPPRGKVATTEGASPRRRAAVAWKRAGQARACCRESMPIAVAGSIPAVAVQYGPMKGQTRSGAGLMRVGHSPVKLGRLSPRATSGVTLWRWFSREKDPILCGCKSRRRLLAGCPLPGLAPAKTPGHCCVGSGAGNIIVGADLFCALSAPHGVPRGGGGAGSWFALSPARRHPLFESICYARRYFEEAEEGPPRHNPQRNRPRAAAGSAGGEIGQDQGKQPHGADRLCRTRRDNRRGVRLRTVISSVISCQHFTGVSTIRYPLLHLGHLFTGLLTGV